MVLLCLLCAGLAGALAAQQEQSSKLQALAELARQLGESRTQLAQAQKAPGDAAEQASLEASQRRLEDRFTSLATGIDMAALRDERPRDYDLQAEIVRLLQPLVRALSRATEGPRQIQEIKDQQLRLQGQLANATKALAMLERAQVEAEAQAADDRILLLELALARDHWRQQTAALRAESKVLAAHLESLERERAPISETLAEGVAAFLRERGLSVLLAAAAAAVALLTLRLVQRGTTAALLRARRRLPVRLVEVAFQALSGVVAALCVVGVFYARGDFELVALAIVFLIGLGWALSRTLPALFEQMRLLLNAGAVREGERLLIDGVPYRVDAIRTFSRLVNPELQGGVLRLPLKDLVGRASRPLVEGEPWFPCRVGDWLALGQGQFGLVQSQTPEQVVLLVDRAPRCLRTADFLASQPRNLSRGFLLSVTFGLDYRHQREVVQQIPERLQARLREQLAREKGGSDLLDAVVEFAAASSSSLDLQAICRFGGAAAEHRRSLERAMQRILVLACTEAGWSIPFPQLTIHRADADRQPEAGPKEAGPKEAGPKEAGL